MPARLRVEAHAALRAIGAEVVASARLHLRRSDGPHPSAPGQPPRDAAGQLADSLVTTLDEETSRVAITATDPVAAFLEYGTRTMAPRPFLRPSVEDARSAAAGHCRQALDRAARGAEDDP